MHQLAGVLTKVRRALARRGWSQEDAEDLVQEAFVKVELYERSNKVRSREALLTRTALNLAVDHARRRAAGPIFDQGDAHLVADRAPDPFETVYQQARLRHAAQGFAQLPERTQRILLKRRLENLSFAEIALSEAMSVAAVEKQVARATLRLMDWMAEW